MGGIGMGCLGKWSADLRKKKYPQISQITQIVKETEDQTVIPVE